MNILVSGGHLTPALAFIDKLKEVRPDVTVVFAGRSKMQKTTDQPAHEYRLVRERTNTIFEHFDSGKWGVGSIFYKAKQLGLTLLSLPRALLIVSKYRPKVFVSFGGYLALPLAAAAKLMGVPVVTHEQTRTAGLANQLIAQIADAVAVSYPETTKFFPAKKTIVTGNLVRENLKKKAKKPDWFKLKVKKPLLYITGGSQGSEIINTTVSYVIPQLLKEWVVIHQCGPKSKARDWQKELTQLKKHLPPKLKGHYLVKEWFDASELAWIYQHADLVVGRSGANTVSELKTSNLPAIFIPLKLARKDEQTKNAQAVAEAGGAVIIPQSELSPERLLEEIEKTKPKLKTMRQALKKLPPEKNGTDAFVPLVLKYLP